MDQRVETVTYERNMNDFTVNVHTNIYKYCYFHVSFKDAKHAMWLYSKGYGHKVWHLLKGYEFGRKNKETGEKMLNKQPI